MITLGKRGDLHARRQALAFIQSKDVVHKLFDTIAAKYSDREGGYTRIFKLGQRKGDAAQSRHRLGQQEPGRGGVLEPRAWSEPRPPQQSGREGLRVGRALAVERFDRHVRQP